MRTKKPILNMGEDFNYKGSIIKDYKYYNTFKTLYECYDRWSYIKEEIYNKYYNLLKENSDKLINYGVRSYNSMVIILHAIIEKDGKMYYILITPSYNWYCDYEEEQQ